MQNEEQTPIAEYEIDVSFPKGFSQGLPLLSELGFDSLSISKNTAIAKKVESTDLSGRPSMFFNIELFCNKAKVSFSIPKGCDPRTRRLHATALFLQSLSLVPNAKADLASICRFVLPSLETAVRTSNVPYEFLEKKHADCVSQLSESAVKSNRIIHTAEECARRCAELERQNSLLQARVSRLETVPDSALCEMALDWVATHQGTFSAARFSKENNIPVFRCEEGLDALLRSGALRSSDGRYSRVTKPQYRHFTIEKNGLLGAAAKLAAEARGRFSAFSKKK